MIKQVELYENVSFYLSRDVTKKYSTSFYSASLLFSSEIRLAIWGIYGFVRLADEIVDTFKDFDQKKLLDNFEKDYYTAMEQGISLNPILNAFQKTVKRYEIPDEYIQSFLTSMRNDLVKKDYNDAQETASYIYGSADVVGLMCLKVFCSNDEKLFLELKQPAMKLGSAFQKVNFLRDLQIDLEVLGRTYFPQIVGKRLEETAKQEIITDIRADFQEARLGLLKLPNGARLGVSVAYDYYLTLLRKIERTPANEMLKKRIRVPNRIKLLILVKAYLKQKLNFMEK